MPLGSLASGFSQGIGAGRGLGQLLLTREALETAKGRRLEDASIKKALGNRWVNPDDPVSMDKQAREIFLRHGRVKEAATLDASERANQQLRMADSEFRRQNAAKILYPQLAGDETDVDRLNALHQQNPNLVADLFNYRLEPHRKVLGFELAETPQGKRVTPIIWNEQTQSAGPMTVGATPDGQDRVYSVDPKAIKAGVGGILGIGIGKGKPISPKGRFSETKDGGVLDTWTGKKVGGGSTEDEELIDKYIQQLTNTGGSITVGDDVMHLRSVLGDVRREAQKRGVDARSAIARAGGLMTTNTDIAKALKNAGNASEYNAALRDLYRALGFTVKAGGGRMKDAGAGGEKKNPPNRPRMPKRTSPQKDPEEAAAEARPFLGNVSRNPNRRQWLERFYQGQTDEFGGRAPR